MTCAELIQIVSGFIGSLGFAVLFNVRGKRLVAASLGGLFSWLLFVLIGKIVESEVIAYFIVACAVSAYAEAMAWMIKTPTTPFVITALIPLIPGSSLYSTMTSVFQTDGGEFLQKATHTLQLAIALALGVIAITTVVRVLNKLVFRARKQQI